MPRPKKPRGRPPEKPLPPRIDATAEELARVAMRRPPTPFDSSGNYRCIACTRTISYPGILHEDGKCSECHV